MRKLVIGLIRLYQVCLSPFKPSCCRFFPTCSEYALTAVKQRGVIIGSYLGLKRILRCHPWGGSGVDLVPGSGAEKPSCNKLVE